jgi:putative membrane protein
VNPEQLGGEVVGVKRPHPNLLTYYAIESLMLGPFFPFWLIPRFLRYRSLQYAFDEEGVSMRWGVLFHRQVSLTYARIQDIHLQSNFVERRLGLARVKVQTAAGSATAEMSIDGLQEFAEVRDYLYSRMRGARHTGEAGRPAGATASSDELTEVLAAVVAEIRGLRQDLAAIGEEDE